MAVRTAHLFMRETLPDAPDAVCLRTSDLIRTTPSSVGVEFSESPRTEAEVEACSYVLADIFCAYLRSVGHRG